jgi:hypothetical protein
VCRKSETATAVSNDVALNDSAIAEITLTLFMLTSVAKSRTKTISNAVRRTIPARPRAGKRETPFPAAWCAD